MMSKNKLNSSYAAGKVGEDLAETILGSIDGITFDRTSSVHHSGDFIVNINGMKICIDIKNHYLNPLKYTNDLKKLKSNMNTTNCQMGFIVLINSAAVFITKEMNCIILSIDNLISTIEELKTYF